MIQNYARLFGSAASSSNLASMVNGGSSTLAASANIQSRWCCGEDPELFKERWEKLFAEFREPEKVDPSKISELYDTMKYDALHNRQFLEAIFMPSDAMLEAETSESAIVDEDAVDGRKTSLALSTDSRNGDEAPQKLAVPRSKVGGGGLGALRRRSMLSGSLRPNFVAPPEEEAGRNYASTREEGKTMTDERLGKLRELYRLAKALFEYVSSILIWNSKKGCADWSCSFVSPQEYGIGDQEKLEIGLLTSLPLLKQIVKNLEDVQAAENAKSFFYFTKGEYFLTQSTWYKGVS